MGCNCRKNSSFSMTRYMNLYPSFENTSKVSTRGSSVEHPIRHLTNKKVVYRTPDNRKLKTFTIKPSMLKGFHTMTRK